jgi:hypothetical protein
MFVARKGDPIVCPNGHVGGHVERDISQGETLEPRGDFSLTDAANHTAEGHCAPNVTSPLLDTATVSTRFARHGAGSATLAEIRFSI